MESRPAKLAREVSHPLEGQVMQGQKLYTETVYRPTTRSAIQTIGRGFGVIKCDVLRTCETT